MPLCCQAAAWDRRPPLVVVDQPAAAALCKLGCRCWEVIVVTGSVVLRLQGLLLLLPLSLLLPPRPPCRRFASAGPLLSSAAPAHTASCCDGVEVVVVVVVHARSMDSNVWRERPATSRIRVEATWFIASAADNIQHRNDSPDVTLSQSPVPQCSLKSGISFKLTC